MKQSLPPTIKAALSPLCLCRPSLGLGKKEPDISRVSVSVLLSLSTRSSSSSSSSSSSHPHLIPYPYCCTARSQLCLLYGGSNHLLSTWNRKKECVGSRVSSIASDDFKKFGWGLLGRACICLHRRLGLTLASLRLFARQARTFPTASLLSRPAPHNFCSPAFHSSSVSFPFLPTTRQQPTHHNLYTTPSGLIASYLLDSPHSLLEHPSQP